ncbi:hypothetical protein CEXT_66001 [Caerostris extrusa]|uniref:Uncharacterized protein n=1 Tax=Caerostris extrusa TaxID=172846 RepID=A0AAV4V2W4_CAEEX|nr:hypothetical protein CEXT_66001 [Caerostris extrusa]
MQGPNIKHRQIHYLEKRGTAQWSLPSGIYIFNTELYGNSKAQLPVISSGQANLMFERCPGKTEGWQEHDARKREQRSGVCSAEYIFLTRNFMTALKHSCQSFPSGQADLMFERSPGKTEGWQEQDTRKSETINSRAH